MENTGVIIDSKEEKGYVTLPYNQSDFKDFIIGLLGRPQTINRTIKTGFEISTRDIENIFYLLNQRILQQNEAKLIQFNTKIIYDDNSSIILNSFEEFISYNEVRAISTSALHCSWQYLVKFQDKTNYEKQEIELSFIIGDKYSSAIEIDSLFPIFSDNGFFNVRINHTARSWGADIEALLTNSLKNVMITPSKYRQFVRKYKNKVSIAFAILFFLSSVTGCYIATENFSKGLNEKLISELPRNSDLNVKVSYLLNFTESGVWSKHFFYVFIFIIISVVLAIVFGTWIDDTADRGELCFINFTREDEKRKIRLLKRQNRKWREFILSIIISIMTGVISNYLFTKLKS